MSAETATLVVVDPATAVADKLRDTLGEQSHAEVVAAASLDDARSLLGTVDPGCLVINLDSIDDADGRSFVADAGTDCPIVLLTNSGRELVDDDLLTRTTTVVERADDPDNWGFLLEKIQRHLGTTPSTGSDEQLYRNLVESARDGLYRLDANGHLVYANESWADILGYDREEMLGSHASIAMADGELERGQQVIQQVLEDDDRESEIIDVEMRTKSGERITVAVHFVVLTTEEGAYDGVMGVARDVTERRRDEQKLQEQNERLDEFASVVSHDLRNPLTVAEGRLELLDEEVDSEHVAPIERSLSRMDTLIENLLTLAREGEQVTDTEWVELGRLAEECWQTVATDSATLTVESSTSVRADPIRLRQLLENLVRNGVEHGGADVTVRVGVLPDGFYLEDDGPGIPPADRETVFDSGYSTSADGTGFGLHIVGQIVEAQGWQVRVTDGTDGGARFEITGVEFDD